jgi:hypothetical protein
MYCSGVIESVSSKLVITIIKQRVVVSFIKGTSTPTGLIIQVINNDLFVRRTFIGVIALEMFNFTVFGHYVENYNR